MKFKKLIISTALCFTLLQTSYAETSAELKAKATELQKEAKGIRKTDKIKYKNLSTEANQLLTRALLIDKGPEIDSMMKSLEVQKLKKTRKILIYSRTTGFRHSSIEQGATLLKHMGEVTGAYKADHSEDEAVFNDENLKQYDAILMLSTTLNPIAKPESRAAFEKFLSEKKGLVGIHAATDCHADWENYLEAMGGIFDGHPWTKNSVVTLLNEEPEHACSKHVPQGFKIKDEIYQYKDDKHFTRDKMRVLLSLDLNAPGMPGHEKLQKKMKRKDNDYPVSWLRSFTGSRVFYTNLGHNESTYLNPVAMQHMLTGIQYAFGDIEADATPSAKLGKFPQKIK